MIALLRYLFLKSLRDHVLIGLLISPTVMFVAPTLGVGIVQILRGHGAYPFTIDPRMTAMATATLFGQLTSLMSAIFGAIGAFWVVRDEISNRSAGLFLLARSPWNLSFAATLYGAAVAFGAALICCAAIAAATANLPPNIGRLLLVCAVAALISAAEATALVAISPEIPMLIPVYALALAVAGAVMNYRKPTGYAFIAAVFVASAVAAPFLLRRRCAA